MGHCLSSWIFPELIMTLPPVTKGTQLTPVPWLSRSTWPVRNTKQSRGSSKMPLVPLSAVASTATSVMCTLLPQILWYFPSPGSMGSRRGRDKELYFVCTNTNHWDIAEDKKVQVAYSSNVLYCNFCVYPYLLPYLLHCLSRCRIHATGKSILIFHLRKKQPPQL